MPGRTTFLLVLAGLFLALLLLGGLSLLAGRGDLGGSLATVFLGLRGIRLGAALLIGSALAVAGVLMQGLFRNPLADPSVLGTNAGAVLGGGAALIAFEANRAWLPIPAEAVLPLGCVGGGLLSLVLVLAVARRSRDSLSVLLAGIVMSMFFTALGALVTVMVHDNWQLGRALMRFQMGAIDSCTPGHLLLALPLCLGGIGAAWWWGRQLDVLLLGEDEAASLGIDLVYCRRWLIIWSTFLVAAAVAIGGGVAFVGLVVPHLLRGVIGAHHRRLVPAAALGGALFVLACDILVRLLEAAGTPGQLPLGVISGLVGAPLFLILLVRTRKEAQL
jgi:iron complex transport system permease protein